MKAIAELTPQEARLESSRYKNTYLTHVAAACASAVAALICSAYSTRPFLAAAITFAVIHFLCRGMASITEVSKAYTDRLDSIAQRSAS